MPPSGPGPFSADCFGGYAAWHAGSGFAASDLLVLAAIVVCGFGYAEGSGLANGLGSWQVICWALVISLPISLPVMIARWPRKYA